MLLVFTIISYIFIMHKFNNYFEKRTIFIGKLFF